MKLLPQGISDGRFFTVLLLMCALLSVSVSALFFPTLLMSRSGNDQPETYDLATNWKENHIELPRITKWSLVFSEKRNIRILAVLIIYISSISLEVIIKNRKIAGSIHLFVLFAAIIIGWLFLFSLSLPYAPL